MKGERGRERGKKEGEKGKGRRGGKGEKGGKGGERRAEREEKTVPQGFKRQGHTSLKRSGMRSFMEKVEFQLGLQDGHDWDSQRGESTIY